MNKKTRKALNEAYIAQEAAIQGFADAMRSAEEYFIGRDLGPTLRMSVEWNKYVEICRRIVELTN